MSTGLLALQVATLLLALALLGWGIVNTFRSLK